MSETFTIHAQPRVDARKGASRRLRRQGQVPGILYGGAAEPEMFSVAHSELVKHLENEAFYSTLLNLNLDGHSTRVVLKDLQRHPARPFVLHLDLQRVSQGAKLRMTVPIHFENEAISAGIKIGGQASHQLTEIEVTCLPENLPEYIAVDMARMQLGDTLHVSQLVLPAGVELVHGLDLDAPVVTIHAPYSTDREEAAGGENTSA